jgi:chaperonin cofactor prefoldin
MLKKNDKHQNELANIWNALADSVLEMTGEEIEEEILEDGNDMAAVRQILLNSVKDCRQKNLRDARERYEKKIFSFQETKYDLPESPDEKRNLIQAMLGSMAARNQPQVTAQFRDFENLPDEDLDGVLHQIYALQSAEKSDENQ